MPRNVDRCKCYQRPSPVYHTERPPLLTTLWAWRKASRGSSATSKTTRMFRPLHQVAAPGALWYFCDFAGVKHVSDLVCLLTWSCMTLYRHRSIVLWTSCREMLQVRQRHCWMPLALTSLRLLANHSELESRSKAARFQPSLGSTYATFYFMTGHYLLKLLMARRMGQYCFACCHLSVSSVVCRRL